jgi:modulator of FtsH protease HflC
MTRLFIIIILFIGIIIGGQSFYILNQTEQSVELRFGKAVDKEITPGLKFKVPFVDNVELFDNRLLDLNADPKEVIAVDRKRLIVDAFAKYKIVDALKFYQTVRNERVARNKLNSILESSLREVLGNYPLSALLQAGERVKIMEQMKDIVSKKADSFGIVVQDVRIMRADLPQENSEAIYRRMQTEREREAKEFRAEGQEEAQKITSKADREKVEILANAKKSSQFIRGDADAIATRTFARALSKDPSFYDFYKSLEAYKKSIANSETNILISPRNRFLKYFRNIDSK